MPLSAWCSAAAAAAWATDFSSQGANCAVETPFAPLMPLAAATACFALLAFSAARPVRKAEPSSIRTTALPTAPCQSELSPDDLGRLRLLLDRALQPIETFEGFEWLDQSQTAAVRYQINFISYALSMMQRFSTPAFSGYADEAQIRLAAKLQDHRVWGYWKAENLFGNLRWAGDPIARDNIMFSGFATTQLAFARNASGGRLFGPNYTLDFNGGKSGEMAAYAPTAIQDVLMRQYEAAPFGLLPCEPHWIYPLCNAITLCGLQAAEGDSDRYLRIVDRFQRGLNEEFTLADGAIIPFLSSLTGLSGPGAGGPMMQAYFCFWLHPILPNLAERHWAALRQRLAAPDGHHEIWPIDVGNYRLSRAAGYATIAAAARELGDAEIAEAMLARLEEDCPPVSIGDIPHRPDASLWTHAVELMARLGGAGNLGCIACETPTAHGPLLMAAPYPDVLVAAAFAQDGRLELVLYPGRQAGRQKLVIGQLTPGEAYAVEGGALKNQGRRIIADQSGQAVIEPLLDGRTPLCIHRIG